MVIRNTNMNDLNTIMDLYAYAREQMILNGNPTQWGKTNPTKEVIVRDIKNNNSYVIEENNIIYGVFTFIIGADETYNQIDGSWLNDEQYGTIHRIASSGKKRGILDLCLNYCSSIINNIRIDTHEDNKIMQHLLEKNNFVKCGIIHVEDGTPRIAYQRII
jgi:hypothetical protein